MRTRLHRQPDRLPADWFAAFRPHPVASRIQLLLLSITTSGTRSMWDLTSTFHGNRTFRVTCTMAPASTTVHPVGSIREIIYLDTRRSISRSPKHLRSVTRFL